MIQFLQEYLGEPLAQITVLVKPIPASRPRVGKFGAYYPKPYTDWMAAARRCIPTGKLDPGKRSRFTVLVESFIPRPKTTILDLPIGDVDNYAKGPLDVITKVGGYWLDDKQIKTLIATKEWTEPTEARSVVTIWKSK